MSRYSSLRASDADRDAIAERLRRAAIEGRLEADELEQRLHAALRARTYGELGRLVADLPAPRQRRRAGAAPLLLAAMLRLAVLLAVVAVAIGVLALTAAWWLVCAVLWLTLRARHQGPRIGRHYRPRMAPLR